MLTGRIFDAEEALPHRPRRSTSSTTTRCSTPPYAKAEQIMLNTPFGVALTKEGMWTALEIPGMQAAIDLENRQQIMVSATADHREAMQRSSSGAPRSTTTPEPRRLSRRSPPGQPVDGASARRSTCVCSAMPASLSPPMSGWWQATKWPSPISRSCGSSVRHTSVGGRAAGVEPAARRRQHRRRRSRRRSAPSTIGRRVGHRDRAQQHVGVGVRRRCVERRRSGRPRRACRGTSPRPGR